MSGGGRGARGGGPGRGEGPRGAKAEPLARALGGVIPENNTGADLEDRPPWEGTTTHMSHTGHVTKMPEGSDLSKRIRVLQASRSREHNRFEGL